MACGRGIVHAALLVAGTWIAAPRASALEEPATCEEKTLSGSVTAVKKGRVYVNLGSSHGIVSGMHIAVIPKKAVPSHPKYGSAFLSGCSDDVTAVVELDDVGPKESSGLIGRGSAAVKGDVVVLTNRPTTHRRKFPGFPFEYRSIWDLSFRFMVMPVGEGPGFPMDFSISYQPDFPIRLTAYVRQIFVATGGDSAAELGLMLSYSTRFFEVGLGLGGYMDNLLPVKRFSVAQYFRLGARHGLRLELVNFFVWDYRALPWNTVDDRGLRWDSLDLEAVVPVSSRVALFVRAARGGGNTDLEYMRITTGVHIYASGYGGPGTVVVPVGIGGGYYWHSGDCGGDIACVGIDQFGPIISTGLEARW
jgi:hypothetical protein